MCERVHPLRSCVLRETEGTLRVPACSEQIHLRSPEPAPYLGDQFGVEAPVLLVRTSSRHAPLFNSPGIYTALIAAVWLCSAAALIVHLLGDLCRPPLLCCLFESTHVDCTATGRSAGLLSIRRLTPARLCGETCEPATIPPLPVTCTFLASLREMRL